MLTVRIILEIYKNCNSVILKKPNIIDVSIVDNNLWFHLENGTLLNASEYKFECERGLGFEGLSGIFLLDTEDAITEVHLTYFQLKHRIVHLKLKEKIDYILCGLIYALENLPLSQLTLKKLMIFIQDLPKSKSKISFILKNTCKKLIAVCQYIFYDDKNIVNIPPVIRLYYESKKAQANIINKAYFNKSSTTETLSLNTKKIRNHNKNIEQLIEDIYKYNFHQYFN